MKTHVERIVRVMVWANRQFLAALRDCPAVHGEALPLLAHVAVAEHIWLVRLRRRPAVVPLWPQLSLCECERLVGENAAEYAGLLRGLGEADLRVAVRYRNIWGEEFATPVIDILTHVAVHGAYHRGQVAKALGRAGVPVPNTDYITYARSVKLVPA